MLLLIDMFELDEILNAPPAIPAKQFSKTLSLSTIRKVPTQKLIAPPDFYENI